MIRNIVDYEINNGTNLFIKLTKQWCIFWYCIQLEEGYSQMSCEFSMRPPPVRELSSSKRGRLFSKAVWKKKTNDLFPAEAQSHPEYKAAAERRVRRRSAKRAPTKHQDGPHDHEDEDVLPRSWEREQRAGIQDHPAHHRRQENLHHSVIPLAGNPPRVNEPSKILGWVPGWSSPMNADPLVRRDVNSKRE